MIMLLPKLPRIPFLKKHLSDLWKYLERTQIRAGRGINIHEDPSGVIISTNPGIGGGSEKTTHPFQIVLSQTSDDQPGYYVREGVVLETSIPSSALTLTGITKAQDEEPTVFPAENGTIVFVEINLSEDPPSAMINDTTSGGSFDAQNASIVEFNSSESNGAQSAAKFLIGYIIEANERLIVKQALTANLRLVEACANVGRSARYPEPFLGGGFTDIL